MSSVWYLFVCVAAVIVAVAVTGLVLYFIIKRYFHNQQKQQMLQMKIDERKETLKVVTPIRLQAYERMALFLERISPNSLVLRCYQPGMDLKLLQGVLTKNIRDEWEHNLSQQIYVSSEAWIRISEAKEQMINLVNSSALNLGESKDPTSLAGAIFTVAASNKVPTDTALEFLKAEIHQYFE